MLKKQQQKSILIFLCFLGGCVTLSIGEQPTINTVCKSMKEDQQLVTLFSENFVPVNCRSSMEGVWQFAYQVRNY